MDRQVSQVVSRTRGLSYRRRDAVNNLVIPLVKDSDLPVAIGNARELERAIFGAPGEIEFGSVRTSQAHIALGIAEGIARAAAIKSLVRRPAHVYAGDLSFKDAGTRAVGVGGLVCADSGLAPSDNRGFGKTDSNVISGRAKLLEVARFADLYERVVSLPPVQGVGLEPLFPSCDAIGSRRSYNAVPPRRQVGHDSLACQRRQTRAVGLIRGADRDHARDARLRGII